MKLIQPSVEITEEKGLKKIELIGRVSYKSEDRITEDSALNFCRDRLKTGHISIFAHEFVYFNVSNVDYQIIKDLIFLNPFVKLSRCTNYIGLSYRTIVDLLYDDYNIYKNTFINGARIKCLVLDIIRQTPYLIKLFNLNVQDWIDKNINTEIFNTDATEITIVSPEIIKIKARDLYVASLKFTCDRGISHEIVRHVSMAYCQESTRFCNYSKDKFGNELNIIDIENIIKDYPGSIRLWKPCIKHIEEYYKSLTISYGLPVQIARGILPNNLKTEIWITGTIAEWEGEYINQMIGDIYIKENKGFIPQRTQPSAHPQIIPLAKKAKELIENIK